MRAIIDIQRFFMLTVKNRYAIWELAVREFENQYRKTYLGIVWGILNPLSYVLVLVLVFSIGLRTNPGGKTPFVVYLICGILPWQFFTGTLASLSRIIQSYSYLVKKGDFNLGMLHVAKIISNLFSHLMLMAVVIIITWFYHYPLSVLNFQVLYYIVMMCLFLLGLGWITSSISVFVEDVASGITIIIQLGFWITPIFWNIDRIPVNYQWLIKLNPMVYIINGYRDSLLFGIPFWTKIPETLYFWIVTILMLGAGALVFRRLKLHFGEVL